MLQMWRGSKKYKVVIVEKTMDYRMTPVSIVFLIYGQQKFIEIKKVCFIIGYFYIIN